VQITNCRSCGSNDLRLVLDLGRHPIANALLREEELDRPEPKFPLGVVFCAQCALLQVTLTVPPDILYRRDYPYFSSSSPALLRHSADHVEALVRERHLGRDSLVVEVASNDGYLLRNFLARCIACLGIDPADGARRSSQSRRDTHHSRLLRVALRRATGEQRYRRGSSHRQQRHRPCRRDQ
jgi:hypothetical protein